MKKKLDKSYWQKYFAERREKGLCKNCPNNAQINKFYCVDCANKIKIRMKKRYEKKLAEGICVRCKEKAMPNLTLCKLHSGENNKKAYIPKENLAMAEKVIYLTDEIKETISQMKRDRKLIGQVIDALKSKSKAENTAISNYYYGKNQ